MPERIVALFPHRPDQRETVQRMFLDAGLIEHLLGAAPSGLLYRVELPDDDAARRLTLAAAAHEVGPLTIQRYLKPSAKELAAAPLLVMGAGGPAAGQLKGHPRKGTSYDEGAACRHCGAGLVQTSPLRLRKTELPQTARAACIGDEIVLPESAADRLAARGLAGIAFREVQDTAGGSLPWRQLVVGATMPPMLASSRGLVRGRAGAERPCPLCGRDGWFDTTSDPFLPVYAKAAVAGMPDAAWTRELFSTGAWAEPIHGRRSLAMRRLIVRPAVHAIVKELKVRGLSFGLVRVE